MTDYQILEAETAMQLSNLVVEALANDWVLQGGVNVSEVGYHRTTAYSGSEDVEHRSYAQAMIKTKP